MVHTDRLNWFHFDTLTLRRPGFCSVCGTETNLFNQTTNTYICSCACANKKMDDMSLTAQNQDTLEG